MDNTEPQITTASVKVMRSHDYCHFEVILGGNFTTLQEVDDVRKAAARLADKAVEQYKIAKGSYELRARHTSRRERRLEHLQRLLKIPEGDRTPDQMAEIKSIQDAAWSERAWYDYEDDWRGYDDEEDESDLY